MTLQQRLYYMLALFIVAKSFIVLVSAMLVGFDITAEFYGFDFSEFDLFMLLFFYFAAPILSRFVAVK